MIITFKSKKLEKILTNYKSLQKNYGNLSGSIIKSIRSLEAAENLHEAYKIPALRLHQLLGNRNNQFGITLNGNYRLIIESSDHNTEKIQIISIKIIEITDYH